MANETEKKIVTAVALGDFDGMHSAHNIVVTGATRVVIYCVHNRFSLMQKSLFEKRYPNAVFADFEKIKDMDGEEFIEEILLKEFDAGIVLCGFNFKFGKNASWSALDLREYLEKKGVWVRILEHQDYKGLPISSTRIRQAVADGQMEDVNAMLGYNFVFENVVLHGDARGRTIGFPTINQKLPDSIIVPKYGVYESKTIVDGKSYRSFTNIGLRPTWILKEPLSETHIFDFNGNLYDKTVQVELVRYLRNEKEFSSVDELKKQLQNDKSSII